MKNQSKYKSFFLLETIISIIILGIIVLAVPDIIRVFNFSLKENMKYKAISEEKFFLFLSSLKNFDEIDSLDGYKKNYENYELLINIKNIGFDLDGTDDLVAETNFSKNLGFKFIDAVCIFNDGSLIKMNYVKSNIQKVNFMFLIK